MLWDWENVCGFVAWRWYVTGKRWNILQVQLPSENSEWTIEVWEVYKLECSVVLLELAPRQQYFIPFQTYYFSLLFLFFHLSPLFTFQNFVVIDTRLR
jgi:hypothetical protein